MKTGARLAWFAAAALLVAAAAPRSAGQTNGGTERSTSDGVYTAAQSGRGEQTYMSICVSCHPAGTYTTPAFRATWNGRPLADLFTQISENMPKNDPGSLSAQEYGDVVAYILKINGAPAGKAELPAETDSLKQIRIEMPEK